LFGFLEDLLVRLLEVLQFALVFALKLKLFVRDFVLEEVFGKQLHLLVDIAGFFEERIICILLSFLFESDFLFVLLFDDLDFPLMS
jgi:hypothetical protein